MNMPTNNHENWRTVIIVFLLVTLLVLIYLLLTTHISKLERRLISREQTLKELMPLKKRHIELSAEDRQLTKRIATNPIGETPADIIEKSGVVAKSGIQVKPLPRQEKGGFYEEGAEVVLNGLGMNEMINLLHYLEYGTRPMTIRKALIRTSFSDPSKLDLLLSLGIIRPIVAERQ